MSQAGKQHDLSEYILIAVAQQSSWATSFSESVLEAIQTGYQEEFFTEKDAKHWNELPGEAVEPTHLEVSKK